MSTSLGTTNEMLTYPQRSRVRQLLDDAYLERHTIDAEILRAQQDLNALYERRRQYPVYVSRLQTALAPHKDLPSEVLSEIFLKCFFFDDYRGIVPVTHFRRGPLFPWVLGQVCSRWRQIVLNDARLWASISFSGYDPRSVWMLQEAFKRSGRSPLRLDVCGRLDTSEYFVRDVTCPEAHRITHLRLNVSSEIFYDFLCLPPGLFIALEEVSVETSVKSRAAALHGVPNPSVFRGSFRLQNIEIMAPFELLPPTFLLLLGLSWHTLTHIDFLSIPIQLSIALTAVSQCTSLRGCCLALTADSFLKVVSPAASIRLPQLQSLLIQEYERNPDVLGEFLRPLMLPALEDFTFSLWERTLLEDLAPLTELAGIVDSWSRGPALRAELLYWGKNLAEVAGPLSFLTSIDAIHSVLPASGIRMMAQEQYLPRLLSLRASVACADMDGFIDMLKTRWERAVGWEGLQQQTGARVWAICSGSISVLGADYELISEFSREIREVLEETGVPGVEIYLS